MAESQPTGNKGEQVTLVHDFALLGDEVLANLPELKTEPAKVSESPKEPVKAEEQTPQEAKVEETKPEVKPPDEEVEKEEKIITEFKTKEPKGFSILQSRADKAKAKADLVEKELLIFKEKSTSYETRVADYEKQIREFADLKVLKETLEKDPKGFLRQAVPGVVFQDELADVLGDDAVIKQTLEKEFSSLAFIPEEAMTVGTESYRAQKRLVELQTQFQVRNAEKRVRAEQEKTKGEELKLAQAKYQKETETWLASQFEKVSKDYGLTPEELKKLQTDWLEMSKTPQKVWDPEFFAKAVLTNKLIEKAMSSTEAKKKEILAKAAENPASIATMGGAQASKGLSDSEKEFNEIFGPNAFSKQGY